MVEKSINVNQMDHISALFGSFDENIKLLEHEYEVNILYRDSSIKILGSENNVDKALKVINELIAYVKKGEKITEQIVRYFISLINDGIVKEVNDLFDECVCATLRGKSVKPKTIGQKNYCNAIQSNTITFGVGPAGTGKTYLAVASAVSELKSNNVKRVILTRPAVEAGEKLGFLPGDLQQKIDPYLRPIYDSLFDLLGVETYQRYVERGIIEIAPLAYMRGRTLDDSFVILDEAQNTTREQMKMFLTRLGFGSKMVITGDLTQIDLPKGCRSGLKDALDVLKDVKDIYQIYFNEKDVVRHKLVQDIVKAYDAIKKKEAID